MSNKHKHDDEKKEPYALGIITDWAGRWFADPKTLGGNAGIVRFEEMGSKRTIFLSGSFIGIGLTQEEYEKQKDKLDSCVGDLEKILSNRIMMKSEEDCEDCE